ncbi:MAG: methyltransferase domain-containing protein [Deltaproteobacteria bacterium]|nr:methyltransferase domain-containing protein [Deltaproteobacteria bacterium]
MSLKPEKRCVRSAFSKAAPTYDGFSDFQHEAAIALADLLRRHIGNDAANIRQMILDVGCGTGHLTGALKTALPGSCVSCADFALPMLMASKAKMNVDGKAKLVACDLDHLPFVDSAFDVVASNLAYQWSPDLERSFAQAKTVLRPDGLFIITTLVTDTLKELRRSCIEAGMDERTFMTFESPEAVQNSIEAIGFEILKINRKPVLKRYADMYALIRTLKKIGANPRSGAMPRNAILKRANRLYKERFPSEGGGIKATYDIIFVVAEKH